MTHPFRLLLIDSSRENLASLVEAVPAHDPELIQCNDPEEAIRRISEQEFSAAFLEASDVDLARRIRQLPRNSSLPLVFLVESNLTPPLPGAELGIVTYLFKPFHAAALRGTLDLLAALHRQKTETETLEESQAFLESMFENIPTMVFVKDAEELRFVRFNRAGEELLGHSRDDLMGKNDYDFFPADQADFFTANDRAVLAGKTAVETPEETIDTRFKGRRILRTRKIPVFNNDGRPAYLLGISEDITEWKKAEAERFRSIREQAALEERERAAARTAFLAEASTVLASSLDYRQTLEKLARLSVPILADWCSVFVARPDGTLERVAAAHREPSKTPLIEELPPLLKQEDFDEASRDERHRMTLGKLGYGSWITAPIETRGNLQGVIVFVSSPRERFGDERGVAEELGRRAAVAIDNALLYEAARAAIQARDEFMSIASHELKTPLTSLKLQLQIARKGTVPENHLAPSPEKLAKILDTSAVQIDRLTLLIDDLLDVTRIQAGKLTYQFEPIDAAAVLIEMVERFEDQLLSAGCEVSVHAPSPILVRADRFRLEQVILNLLSNAAKYGAGKPVEASVVRRGDVALLSCRDHGIGIPDDQQEKVFERFERVAGMGHQGGLGLGLYIAREIVRAHQGSIRIESPSGPGSIFVVELPLC